MQPDWYKYKTHCHVVGGSQYGKTKFFEDCIRRHIDAGNGVLAIPWNKPLYDSLVAYLSFVQPKRPVILIDPSNAETVYPYNPWLRNGAEVSSHVSRLVDATITFWGAKNSNEMPTYERIAKLVSYYALVSRQPLQHAAKILEYPKKELREQAIAAFRESGEEWAEQQLKELQYVRSLSEWHRHVLSTQNRLGRLLSSKGMVRFMGLNESIDLGEAMRQKAIILVNLAWSPDFDQEVARTFAALMLNELFYEAMQNADDPVPYYVYLDECQEYLPPFAGKMLDQVLKTGLRLTLSHHHFKQGVFIDDEHLRNSLMGQAQIKVVFGGLPFEQSALFVNEVQLDQVNKRQVKARYFRTITKHVLEPHLTQTEGWGQAEGDTESWGKTRGHTHGTSDGFSSNETSSSFSSESEGEHSGFSTSGGGSGTTEGFSSITTESSLDSKSHANSKSRAKSRSHSTAFSTRYGPREAQELASETDWTREERVSMLVEKLKNQERRHCTLKLPGESARDYVVPWIEPYLPNPDTVAEYMKEINRDNRPAEEVDRLLIENQNTFLKNATKEYSANGAGRPKRRTIAP